MEGGKVLTGCVIKDWDDLLSAGEIDSHHLAINYGKLGKFVYRYASEDELKKI